MSEVARRVTIKAVKGIKPSESRSQLPVAESQVPLAHSVGRIPQLSQGLRQQLHRLVHPAKVCALDLASLHTDLVCISIEKI